MDNVQVVSREEHSKMHSMTSKNKVNSFGITLGRRDSCGSKHIYSVEIYNRKTHNRHTALVYADNEKEACCCIMGYTGYSLDVTEIENDKFWFFNTLENETDDFQIIATKKF